MCCSYLSICLLANANLLRIVLNMHICMCSTSTATIHDCISRVSVYINLYSHTGIFYRSCNQCLSVLHVQKCLLYIEYYYYVGKNSQLYYEGVYFQFCLQFFIVRCGLHYYFNKNIYISIYTVCSYVCTGCSDGSAKCVHAYLPSMLPTIYTLYILIQVCCCDFFYTSSFTCSSVKYILCEKALFKTLELHVCLAPLVVSSTRGACKSGFCYNI